ncbi:hypothetical protein HPB49_018593 [Dermacentor silvarum]|uniref:Uncharacterized protein n=1 Tax=Dermacentor silvarum TaxID=543639 RepID=A0ACB8C4Y6_DERSI|nr:hypothetical protein HPB49_018593 [Dermacentor silvarum]
MICRTQHKFLKAQNFIGLRTNSTRDSLRGIRNLSTLHAPGTGAPSAVTSEGLSFSIEALLLAVFWTAASEEVFSRDNTACSGRSSVLRPRFTLYLIYYGGVATDDKSVSHHYELAKWLVVVGNAPAMAVAYFLVKYHDRLATIVMVMSTVSIALAVQSALVAFDLSLPLAVLIMWMKLLLNITYVVLCVHTVAMFPTEVRSVGFSGTYMWGRLGATSASALKEIEDQLIGSVKALPLAMSALALALASLFLVTLGDEALPEASMMAMMWHGEPQRQLKR